LPAWFFRPSDRSLNGNLHSIPNTNGTNFKEMAVPGDWVVIAKLEASSTYPRRKPPLLEGGFSRQGELCEHFLFGNRKTEHRRKRTEMTDDSRRCFVVVQITDSMAAGLSCEQTARNNRHLLSALLSLQQ
jgi:hypothetical protein